MESIQPNTPTENVEKRYSIEELKALGGVSHAFIYNHVRRGTLAKPEKWGRASRWKESDVKAWLATFQTSKG